MECIDGGDCVQLLDLAVTGVTCSGSGQQTTAEITILFQSPPHPGVTYYWNFGDGPNDIIDQNSPSTTTSSVTHAYAQPGMYIVQVLVMDGSCFPQTVSYLITVPPCCPSVTDVQIDQQCGGEGTIIVAFSATTEPVDDNTTAFIYSWDFGDGNTLQTNGPVTSHPYAATGSYDISVTVTDPANNICSGNKFQKEILVDEDCSRRCPELKEIKVSRQKCVKLISGEADGTARVSFEVVADRPQPGTYKWSFGDGSAESTTATGTSHVYTSSGEQLVTVEYTSDDKKCNTKISKRFKVEKCPVTKPKQTDISINLCFLFKSLMFLGLGLFTLGVILVACPQFSLIPPNYQWSAGSGLMVFGGVIFAVSLILYFIFCPFSWCNILALFWQAAFIVGALFIYAGLCPGCQWFLAGIIVLLTFLGMLVIWIWQCNPTPCTILWELLTVTIAFDICGLLEVLIGKCVITSNFLLALGWILAAAVFNTFIIYGLARYNCRRP